MKTPICDFVRRYRKSDPLRLHMPGHKGICFLGSEPYDITEIDGADSLYAANGIISESEANAGLLFGSRTFYSAEGSSLCIRAMLYLTALYARESGKKAIIAAGRNVHKTFLSAIALLDIDVVWLYPESEGSYLSCDINASALDKFLSDSEEKPTAVYITSPDYLGSISDLSAVSKVCRKHGVLLLADNAHGAYLKFLPESKHPTDLGADMCCDSAHKTLSALTGAAYLHVSENAPSLFHTHAKNAMAMFGSTSPSYLILESLDELNRYLSDGYKERLSDFIPKVRDCRQSLTDHGYTFYGDEPLKLTLCPKAYGYNGTEIAGILLENGIVCEFYDPDFVVFMLTPEIGEHGIKRFAEAMLSIPRKEAIPDAPPVFSKRERVMSVRDASLSPSETVPVKESIGRVLACATVACPPAVPIVVCGERIDSDAVKCFDYYGIGYCDVVKDY